MQSVLLNSTAMASVDVLKGSTTSTEPICNGVVSPESSPTGSDEERRDNVMFPWQSTLVLSFANFAMGLVTTVFGTTLIHMSLFFHVSVAKMSLTLTLESIIFLVGSVLYGLIGSRLDYDFLTATTVVLMGLTTTCAPLIFGFPGFVTSIAIRGIVTGFFQPLVALYCINACMHHRYRDLVIQAQNAFNAVGATVAPLIINNFLVDFELEQTVSNVTVSCREINTTSPTTEQNYSVVTSFDDGLDRVIYAYIVVGLVTVMCGVPAVVLFICRGAPRPCIVDERRRSSFSDDSRRNSATSSTGLTNQTRHHRQKNTATQRRCSAATGAVFFFVLILFSAGFFCGAVEIIPRSYLIVFAVEQLSWSSNDATKLVSVFDVAYGFGGIIGVPMSAFLQPGQLLIGNSALTTTGLIALLVVGTLPATPTVVAWLGVIGTGLGISTLSALVLLIMFEYRYLGIVERATISATVSTGINIGSAVAALLVGHLSDDWTPLCLVYFTAGSLACLLAVFGVRLAVIDRLKRLTSTATVYSDAGKKDIVTETTSLLVASQLSRSISRASYKCDSSS